MKYIQAAGFLAAVKCAVRKGMIRVEALYEDNCRGGTEVSVKISCDGEENIMFGKALMWPCWKED